MANKRSSGGIVEDIWMNTQASPDDFGALAPTGPGAPASWNEVEEANVLLNPDAASMEGRG
jgi:hypothetical protein